MAKQRIIFDNYNNYDFDDIRDFLLEEYDEEDVTDYMVWEQARVHEEADWEDARYELKRFFDDAGTFLVCGDIGRWNGTFSAGNVYDDFNKAISDMAMHCDYIKIWDENGHLYVKCSHHDGTNYFEIKLINDKASEFIRNWEDSWSDDRTESDIHDIVWSSNFLSRLPHFAHRVWGCKKRDNKAA